MVQRVGCINQIRWVCDYKISRVGAFCKTPYAQKGHINEPTVFRAFCKTPLLVRLEISIISSFLLYSFPYPLYKLHFVADNVYSKALNMCSKVLNICSKALNIRSKVLNKDFLGANKNLRAHNKNFLPYAEIFYA